MRVLVFQPGKRRLALAFAYTRLLRRPATFAGGPLALQSRPEFTLPGPRWVKLRPILSGICGSDLKTLRLQFSLRSSSLATRRSGGEPLFLGHEIVGRVVETGPGVRGLETGQRVVVHPASCCASLEIEPPCVSCRSGRPCLCLHRDAAPSESPIGGGWCERLVRHESQVRPIPDGITDEQAVLYDPLACSTRVVLRRPPRRGDRVLVIGGGTIGLGIVAVLRALDVDTHTVVLARHRHQAALAHQLGADVTLEDRNGSGLYERLAEAAGTSVLGVRRQNRLLLHGFDVIYDAVGSAATLHHGLRWVRPGGSMVLEGINLFPGRLDRTPLWHREVEIVGCHGHGQEEWKGRTMPTFERLTGWILTGRLRPEILLTHRFELADYRAAITVAADKAGGHAVKVAFELTRTARVVTPSGIPSRLNETQGAAPAYNT